MLLSLIFFMEKLNLFFSRIRELTFWQRLFSWRHVRNLSYDAFEEFKTLQKDLYNKKEQYDSLEKKLLQATTQSEGLHSNIQQFEKLVYKKE